LQIDRDKLAAVLAVPLRPVVIMPTYSLRKHHTAQIFCEQDRIERVTAGIDAGAGIRVI
jgi:hypothetical protein